MQRGYTNNFEVHNELHHGPGSPQPIQPISLTLYLNIITVGVNVEPQNGLISKAREDFKEYGGKDVQWIQLAQDRIQWRAFVNTILNLRDS
jgi:hypothetical protein